MNSCQTFVGRSSTHWRTIVGRLNGSLWLLVAIAAFAAMAGCNESASGQSNFTSASGQLDFTSVVNGLISTAQTTNPVPSLCVAIGKKGNVIYSSCSGLIDVADKIPATPTSIYRIASVTKQFTAALIMLLANQNPPALSLSDPVSKYVPELSSDPAVTIMSLLNMSAGLVDYTTLPEVTSWFNGVAPATVIDALAPLPLDFPAGAAFEYSNSDPFVLGAVIESISGMSYSAYIQNTLLGPYGLNSTHYGPSPTGANAIGYTLDDSGAFVPALVIDPSALYAAGALTSDVLDIVKWDWLLLGGALLPAAAVSQMTTPPPINGSSHSEPSVYGFGLIATELYGRPLVMHGGTVPGFNDVTSTFTDIGWSIAVMSNISVNNYPVTSLWRQIVAAVSAPDSQFRSEC